MRSSNSRGNYIPITDKYTYGQVQSHRSNQTQIRKTPNTL